MPGTDPLAVLDGALATSPNVLVVDQAEEALLADDGAHIGAFADRILAAVESGVRIVLALRADFYGRLAEHPALARKVGPATVLVAPPDDAELRRIVTEPASRVGLRVEPALADLVVAEVRGRPGALPVLSTALVRAWEQREGDTLTVASYRAGGGVEAALQRVGEEAWAALEDAEQRSACRRLLLRLAVDEDGSWVRRRARRVEVAPSGDVAAGSALAVLTDRRLVVARADDVEIAHEALLTGWPRLLGWLEDGRAHAEVRERLAIASAAWDSAGRDETELYAGTRLQAALDTATASPGDISPLEQEFLAQSVAHADRELAEQRERADREARGRRRTRAVAAGLGIALLLAAVAGGYAVRQQRQAEAAANTADAARLGVIARTGGDYDRALLLAAQAVRLDPSPESESDLFATLMRGDAVISTTRVSDVLQYVAFAPDGRSVAAITEFGIVVQLPADGGAATSSFEVSDHRGNITRRLDYLPDGRAIVGTDDGPQLYDLARHQSLDASPVGSAPGQWATTQDGRTLVSAQVNSEGNYDPVLLLWHPGTADVRSPRVLDIGFPPHPDGKNIVTCGQFVCVLTDDFRLLRVRASDATVVTDVQLPDDMSPFLVATPDGRVAAYADGNGVVNLVNPATGATTQQLPASEAGLRLLGFSADGTQLVAGADRTVLVWSLPDGGPPARFEAHAGRVTQAAFSPDGGTLATGGTDKLVMLWDLTGRRRVGSVVTDQLNAGHEDAETSTLWAVPGAYAVGQFNGRQLLFVDATTGAVAPPTGGQPHADAQFVPTARAGRDGAVLISVDDTGTMAAWDTRTRSLLGIVDVPAPEEHHEDGRQTYLPDTWVSPDGRWAATMRSDAGPIIIDVAARKVARQLPPLPDVAATELAILFGWTADGRSLLIHRERTDTLDAELLVVDATSGAVQFRVPIPGTMLDEAAADPTGRFIAMAVDDGTLRIVDAHDGHLLAPPLTANVGASINVSVSPDGRYIAVSGRLRSSRCGTAARSAGSGSRCRSTSMRATRGLGSPPTAASSSRAAPSCACSTSIRRPGWLGPVARPAASSRPTSGRSSSPATPTTPPARSAPPHVGGTRVTARNPGLERSKPGFQAVTRGPGGTPERGGQRRRAVSRRYSHSITARRPVPSATRWRWASASRSASSDAARSGSSARLRYTATVGP